MKILSETTFTHLKCKWLKCDATHLLWASFKLRECEAVLFYLLAAVDAVLTEDRSAACGHPHSSQRVAVNLVLLNHPLALFMLEQGAESAVSHL